MQQYMQVHCLRTRLCTLSDLHPPSALFVYFGSCTKLLCVSVFVVMHPAHTNSNSHTFFDPDRALGPLPGTMRSDPCEWTASVEVAATTMTASQTLHSMQRKPATCVTCLFLWVLRGLACPAFACPVGCMVVWLAALLILANAACAGLPFKALGPCLSLF